MKAAAEWARLDWDTEHFGFPVARLEGATPAERLAGAVEDLRSEGVALAYFAVREPDEVRVAAAVKAGGRLVDRKTTYAAPVRRLLELASASGAEVLEHRGAVTPALRQLALAAGVSSRFAVDPRFPRAIFELLYTRWMERSVSHEIAEAVFVVPGEPERPQGMVTVGVKSGRADIGLVAVSEEGRGRGLGSALVRRAAVWAEDRGLARAQVVTQGSNVAACRLYERCGYEVESIDAVFHFWLHAPV